MSTSPNSTPATSTENSSTSNSNADPSDTHTHKSNQQKVSWLTSMKSYSDPRAIIMLFLGFAAGIPILLIFSSLSLWLREAGIERSVVTMFSWAALGYSFKFIWAPLIDALPVPLVTKWLGRRRAWMLLAQLGVITAILIMASVNPVQQSVLAYMAAGVILLGFSSATQDIVIDAYRVELAPPSMQSILSAMYTMGYRLGMIVAGAGALYLADFFGSTETAYSYLAWRNTYWIMAGVMGVAVLTTLTIAETNTISSQPKKLARNQKVMSVYAAVALGPVILLGTALLIGLIAKKVFGLEAFYNAISGMLPLLGKYSSIMGMFMPVALIYLLLQQPKFTISMQNGSSHVEEKRSDYLRLVALFLAGVVVFVGAFIFIGKLLPDSDSVILRFILEMLRFLTSALAAVASGWLLVKAGLVEKHIAFRVWVEPVLEFFNRYGKQALLLLALIGLYRISDIVAGAISNVFYQDMGFSKTDIATAVKFVGVWVTIAGGFLGGVLAQKMRIMPAMMVGAILACVTNLLFVLLTFHPGDITFMYLAVIGDNLAAGLATTVFVSFLSALTSIRFTAVQYAIFSSLMTLFPKVLAGYSGTIVDNMGYPFFFTFCCLIGVPILSLVYLVNKHMKIGEVPSGNSNQ